MRYVQVSHGSAYIPKLLGIYERELAPYIERAVAWQPRLVVELGAAEGYYAVGMARRLPRAHVVAFEMVAENRDWVREMAGLERRRRASAGCPRRPGRATAAPPSSKITLLWALSHR